MASDGGGKIKGKRGYSSSKPYERRKSLFRRITDSIKDVLRPSWLPGDKEDTPADSENPKSGANDAEGQFFSPAQSPSQMPGQVRPGDRLYPQLPHHDPSDAPGNSTIPWQQGTPGWQGHGQAGRSTWGNSTAPFDRAQFTRSYFAQKHTASAMASESVPDIPPSPKGLGGPAFSATDSSAVAGPSTSMAAGRRRLDVSDSALSSPSVSVPQREGADSSFETPGDSSSKRQRLWSPDISRKGRVLQPAVKDKPAFKISVFSSPVLNESKHESPFYSGRTTFGGASAYRRPSLNSSLPYQNSLPLRKSVIAKPLNNSGNAVLSSSANQILKTLERLSDFKRSRVDDTETESLLNFTPTSYRRPSRPLQTTTPSRSLEMSCRGPPTQRLNLPVAASMARNRQVVSLPARCPPPPTATVTRAMLDVEDHHDVQVIDPQRVRQPRFESEAGPSGFGETSAERGSGKMKHAKSYATRQKAVREEEEVVEIPELRTDFTLPINAIPGFSLGLPQVTPPAKSMAPLASSAWSSSSAAAAGASCQSPPKLQFTFSSPIQKLGPDSTGLSPAPTQDFEFSSPLKVTESMVAGREKPPAAFGGTGASSASLGSFTPAAWGSTAPKPKAGAAGNMKGTPTGGFGSNASPSSPMAFGSSPLAAPSVSASGGLFQSAPQLKSGSVMDLLGGGSGSSASSPAQSSSGFKPAAQLKQGSVMDILGGKASSPSTSSGPSGADNLFAKFAAPSGSWECDACMLQNKGDATKCVACETPKPGAKQSSGSAATKPSGGDSLFAKFAAPSGSWECDACMLQNKGDATKCMACETPKPGAKQTGASTSGPNDSLFAKFAAPSGSWECDACMLQNKGDATKCVACETPKPGAKQSSTAKSPPTDDFMAKFRKPEGAWDCDVCMVQNTAVHTKCLACESPRPGTQATGSVPPPKPALGTVGPGGGLVLSFSSTASSSTPSPFLAPASASKEASGSGFQFGAPTSSTTSSLPAPSGFKFAGSGSTSSSSGNGGFTFGNTSSSGNKGSDDAGLAFGGNKDSSNSNSASSASGFQFGAKDSAGANGTSSKEGPGMKFGSDSTAPAGGGFKFGAPSAGDSSKSPAAQSSASSATGGFSVGASTAGGFAFGSATQSQGKDSQVNSFDKLTSPQSGAKEGSGASTFSPVFGAGKASNSFSLGAAPSVTTGAANSVTTGGFQFGAPSGSNTAFDSNLSSKVTLPGGSDSSQLKSGSDKAATKQPSLPSTFSFGAAAKTNDNAAKPGLFTSALADSNSKNGPSTTAATSVSAGFAFGAAPPSSTTTFAPQMGAGGFGMGSAPASAKPAVNGEVSAPAGLFAFGQTGLSSTAGFSFGTSVGAKDSAQNPQAQTKQPFTFGVEASKPATGKRTLDNDLGPADAKKRSFESFGNPGPAAGNNNLFKFGSSSEGAGGKAPNMSSFGGQAAGFGGGGPAPQGGGFSFSSPQTNAASSTPALAPAPPSLFGAGAGTTTAPAPAQFAFNAGTGSQSNAAAASPFGADTSAPSVPAQGGFSFSGAQQSSFNFGANSVAAPPVFQFGTNSADPGPAPPAPSAGIFLFGQGAPSADSTAQPASFPPAPNAMGFGAATAHNNFSIVSGSEQRKIKRAVRRTRK